MIDIAKIKVGDKVHYNPIHGPTENGIVKEIPHHSLNEVRVVYHCGGEWENFKDYTAALTRVRDLEYGWK